MRSGGLPHFALVFALVSCPPPATGDDRPGPAAARSEPVPALQLPRDVRPLAYRLSLDVDPSQERFSGRVEIDVTMDLPRSVVWLHGLGLSVTSAEVVPAGGGPPVPARYEEVNRDGLARLALPAPVPAGPATLRLSWNAPFGNRVGLLRTRDGEDWYTGTFLEPIAARRVFPGFDDPGFKAPFEIALTVPEGLLAISNGAETGRHATRPGATHIVFRRTPPLPTYLLFVAVGPFDVVAAPVPASELRPQPLPVRGLAPRGRGSELAWALEAANRLLLDQERYFGMPFPYEKLDHVALPGQQGAMENVGAIAYNPDFLLTTPDVSETRRQGIGVTAAHEISHQWFGDLVTPEWWTDIWLNESFATWMGIRSAARVFPAWRKGLSLVQSAGYAVAADGLRTAGPVREPLAAMSDVMGQFDDLRYAKGGALLAMLEGWMGEAAFRAAIQRYLAAHAHGTGSTADLLREMSLVSGKDVAAVASTFLDQPGVPLVEARVRCGGGTTRLTLRQSRWLPIGTPRSGDPLWTIPVCFRHGAGKSARDRCELLASRETTVPLEGGCPSWLMPSAGGRGYYVWSLPPSDLDRLVRTGLVHLTAAEKLSLAQSVDGARRSGALPYDAELRTMLALARDRDQQVAGVPVRFLAEARETLVPDAAVPDVEAVARQAYRPALERLGWDRRPGEQVDDTTFRGEVLQAVVATGRDPAVTRDGAVRGRHLAGRPGEKPDPAAAAPEAAVVALEALVRTEGEPAFDDLLGRFTTFLPVLQRQVRGGLAWGATPALTPRAVQLWGDRRLGDAERFYTLAFLMDRRDTRPAALAEIEANVDAMLAGFGTGIESDFPHITEAACSLEDADRIRALFRGPSERYPGMGREVEKVVEVVTICAAQREAVGKAAARAFREAARKAPAPASGTVR